eukprot:TRINITY_DN44364_c0_g1_i1.p1 TRINITY_DN44364_c0_g1~~TRINITY_DN44364_c0_g1_i1.p1  ORF type:complete len:250 (-),score=27.35 TRINITY_DN44364_c0_g1_i1:105-854(-)
MLLLNQAYVQLSRGLTTPLILTSNLSNFSKFRPLTATIGNRCRQETANVCGSPFHSSAAKTFGCSTVKAKTFEPDYLDSAVPLIPTYPPINIQLKGYNFDVLESYQSYVHNLAENMGIDVEEAWATPPKSTKISTFAKGGTRVHDEFSLHMYERNVQVVNMRSVDAPILIDTIRSTLPEGVQLSFHEHLQEHYEERYIPDPFINSVRAELTASEEKNIAARAEKEAASAAKAARKQAALLKSIQDTDDD